MASWQDAIFTVGSFIFILSLLPTIRSADKPDWRTAAITAAITALFAFAFVTLELWLSAGSTGVLALAWTLVGVQSWKGQRD